MRQLANWLIFLSPFLIIQMGYLIASTTGVYEFWFLFYALRLIVLLVLIIFLIKQLRKQLKLIPVLILIVYAFELGFSFLIQTTLEPLSYSSWLWNGIYKNPINEAGYRDSDWPDNNSVDIVFIGDSFTDGHSIRKTSSRFSDLTASELGQSFVNLGVSGSSTKDQLQTLKSTPVEAKTVVFQYFVNDIEDSGYENGVYPNIDSPNEITELLITSSFIANRLYSLNNTDKRESAYMDFLDKCMVSSEIKSDHLEDIQAVISHCRESKMKLIVIVFPYLREVDATQNLVALVVKKLVSEDVDYIDMSATIEKLSFEQRVVNAYDVHPSTTLNTLTAKALVESLSEDGE